ncbi:MAG: glycosyltransferase family 39 protein, partial [bacterium]|nr:glycosyltransferase family 39 protein [bacterium]
MSKKLLITIIATAALLRIISLGQGDLTGSDEIFYGFRAIGMLDYDHAPKQTTPIEWFDQNNLKNHIVDYPSTSSPQASSRQADKLDPNIKDIPWWTQLSFHDHPPLVFLVQHWFIQLFGEYKFAFRLPSALAGILSVYLVYLIGKKLLSSKAGLISAALMAVTVNAVHNSRLGIQEPILILLMLAATYFFLRADSADSADSTSSPQASSPQASSPQADDHPDAIRVGVPTKRREKYLLLSGAFWGLALIAKYNAIILAPIFLTYILISKRDWLTKKELWLGLLIAVAIFSPVIVYNLELYRAVGHFDFQFSYLLHQNPEIWQSAPGKEDAGSLLSRVIGFIPALAKANSWPLLLLSAAGLLWLIYRRQEA